MNKKMKKQNLAQNIKYLREINNMTQDEVAREIGASDKAVSAWERGEREPRMGAIQQLAKLFNVSMTALIDANKEELSGVLRVKRISNVHQLKRRMIPVLGNIAAGAPIWAEEEYDEYVDDNGTASADFALRVKGDSMEPLIKDGDFVYIKKQDDVYNGQIAVVLDGDSATLKYVYRRNDGVHLVSNNPKYPPMVYTCSDAEQLKILGLAVAYKRSLLNL